MESKQYYKNQLTKILIYAIIAFAATASLIVGAMGRSLFEGILVGIFWSGIPSGWSITGKLFGGWIVTGFVGIMLLIIRLMLSLLIGIFALPIQIINCVSNIRKAPDEPTSNN